MIRDLSPKKEISGTFGWIVLLYGGFILSYLFIRAFVTEFISDEAATYHYFILRGAFWGDNIVLDAANHPLNSWIGFQMYKITGDSIGWLRIGGIISYLFYWWSTARICSKFERKSLKILAFIAINSIPFMMEYFAYSRGYGLSMGFLVCGVYQFTLFQEEQTLKRYLLSILLLFVAFMANLTLINTIFICFGSAFIYQLYYWKSIGLIRNFAMFAINLVAILGMIPFVKLSFKLKEAGALYYSSLDGIWDMTGKTLCKYVLGIDHDFLMWVILGLLFTFFVVFLLNWNKVGLKAVLKQRYTFFMALLFGNILAVLALAFILKVNYPEDRTGMYFIPLFMFLIFEICAKLKRSEIVLLFFPISMLTSLSFHSSVFTPDERITRKFFKEVKKHLSKDESITVYKTMSANWAFLDSKEKRKASVAQAQIANFETLDKGLFDIFVSKDFFYPEKKKKGYTLIAFEPNSGHLAFKRNKPTQKTILANYCSKDISVDGEFLELANIDSLQNWAFLGTLQVDITAHLKIDSTYNSTDLVVATFDDKGTVIQYFPYVLELAYQRQQVNHNLTHHFILNPLQPNEVRLKAYFWNRKIGLKHHLKHGKVQLIHIR